MIRQRVRIRFRKEGDLRLISHRDLARVFERIFRRVGVKLSMSEGFHPKARMSFPSALGLGITGLNEVMDFEVAETVDPAELHKSLQTQCPRGLHISELRLVGSGEGKAQLHRFVYEFPVPAAQRASVQEAVDRLLDEETHLVERPGRSQPVDVRAGVDEITLSEDKITFRLWASQDKSIRPTELLAVLGLSELVQEGHYVTRTEVELRA